MDKNCDFGDAIRHIKNGGRIARDGWNGKGMHVYLARDLQWTAGSFGNAHHGLPCLVMVTATGDHQPGWLASQADMLAEDWTLVP